MFRSSSEREGETLLLAKDVCSVLASHTFHSTTDRERKSASFPGEKKNNSQKTLFPFSSLFAPKFPKYPTPFFVRFICMHEPRIKLFSSPWFVFSPPPPSFLFSKFGPDAAASLLPQTQTGWLPLSFFSSLSYLCDSQVCRGSGSFFLLPSAQLRHSISPKFKHCASNAFLKPHFQDAANVSE